MKLIQLSGTVEEIIFKNEENGYTVFELLLSEDNSNQLDMFSLRRATVVGFLLELEIGESLKISGKWVEHQSYGQQFKMELYEKVNSLENSSKEEEHLKGLVKFLRGVGLSPAHAVKIYKELGEGAVETLNTNLYCLLDLIEGISFKNIDRIALRLQEGTAFSKNRIRYGVKYALSNALLDGHSYLPLGELITKCKEILCLDDQLIDEGLRELQFDNIIKIENVNKEQDSIKAVYLTNYLRFENSVAMKLAKLASYRFKEIPDEEWIFSTLKSSIDVELAENQREAIIESLNNGVVVITGGPGTGKTTTINAMIKVFGRLNLKVELAAPTGRAAKRMSQATGVEAKTIHRLLETNYVSEKEDVLSREDSISLFTRDEEYPLDAEVVIIDEMSMVDVFLMNSLLKALVPGARLILVGDADQLPSVGAGNVLEDIIKSKMIKVVNLNQIFRQAQESLIIVNAHKINSGEKPDLSNGSFNGDFFFINARNAEEATEKVCELCKTRLPSYKNYEPFSDIQVLAPMKKGGLGVYHLNVNLQEALNPKGSGSSFDKFVKKDVSGVTVFRKGDKVMQLKNNYEIEWQKSDNPLKGGRGVYNGDIGIITDVDTRQKRVTVLFDDDKLVEYSSVRLDELELAYAVTIHKSQGSEFKVVVIPLLGGPPVIMNRNLLYTAVTRARELVVIVGNADSVFKMVNNDYKRVRYSALDARLKTAFEIDYSI